MALVFTTGSGPVTELPPAPLARLQHYQIVNTPLTSCSPSKAGTCVSFAVGLPVEASLFVAGSDAAIGFYGPQLYYGPFFTDLSGIMQGTPADCVRLRSRAPNGKTSDPTDLHGPDGGLVPTGGSTGADSGSTGLDASPGGPSGYISASAASCAVSTGQPRGEARATLVALALLGLLRRRAQNRRT
jgi:MYXO-CTERM domain-containing protein